MAMRDVINQAVEASLSVALEHRAREERSLKNTLYACTASILLTLIVGLVTFTYQHGQLVQRVLINTERLDKLEVKVDNFSTIITQHGQDLNDLERREQEQDKRLDMRDRRN